LGFVWELEWLVRNYHETAGILPQEELCLQIETRWFSLKRVSGRLRLTTADTENTKEAQRAEITASRFEISDSKFEISNL
jgi:hypothetical protein